MVLAAQRGLAAQQPCDSSAIAMCFCSWCSACTGICVAATAAAATAAAAAKSLTTLSACPASSLACTPLPPQVASLSATCSDLQGEVRQACWAAHHVMAAPYVMHVAVHGRLQQHCGGTVMLDVPAYLPLDTRSCHGPAHACPRCRCWQRQLASRRSLPLPLPLPLPLTCWLSLYAWPQGSRQASGSGRWWNCATPTAFGDFSATQAPCRARAPPRATRWLPNLLHCCPTMRRASSSNMPAVQPWQMTSTHRLAWSVVHLWEKVAACLFFSKPLAAVQGTSLMYLGTTEQGTWKVVGSQGGGAAAAMAAAARGTAQSNWASSPRWVHPHQSTPCLGIQETLLCGS